MSVVKALEHASMRCDRKLVLHVRRATLQLVAYPALVG